MNSREKGKRGERQWRDELRGHGYTAQRGQQYAGSPESPDVVCPALPWIHFEVKLRERLDIYDAMEQARRECGGKVPVVAHRRSQWVWLITIEAERFFDFLSGVLPPQPGNPKAEGRNPKEGRRSNSEGRSQKAASEGKENPKAEGRNPKGGRDQRSESGETVGCGCGQECPGSGEEFGDEVELVPTREERDALERVPTNKNSQ